MKEEVILLMMALILAVCCLALGYTIGTKSSFKNILTEISKPKNLSCNSTDLFMTSECLQKELSGFYKYNISNIGKELSDDELKNEGGVCSNYAQWYIDNSPNTFNKKLVTFNTGNDSAHEIAIVSNEEGYCILDQLNNNCWRFANETV